jgi:hypothetical protein
MGAIRPLMLRCGPLAAERRLLSVHVYRARAAKTTISAAATSDPQPRSPRWQPGMRVARISAELFNRLRNPAHARVNPSALHASLPTP